jgi:hypothetical protein
MDPDLFNPNGTRRTTVCGPSLPFDGLRRCVFETEGCTIYAWPCRGGTVIKENADIVDMAFLGFDRFSPPTHRFPSDEQAKEDEFARELLKTGGKLWANQRRFAQVGMGWEEAEGEERMCRFFGWERGGVWALCFDVDDEEQPEAGRLKLAVTMEERCRILEKLGARFFADPKECEGLEEVLRPLH